MSVERSVVVTYPGFDEKDEHTAGALREAGFTIRFEPRVRERTATEVARIMGDATAAIVSTDPFDASVFAACPNLRVVARTGVGSDAIDLRDATEAGVAVTITPGVNTSTVADHTIALMLACCRRLVENDLAIRDGRWDRGGALNGIELTGSTVGIVGLGAIGRAVARRLKGFDVTILGADSAEVDLQGIELVSLQDLLATSNIVSLHVPLLASTKGLIRHRELALMRSDAILINASRGGVVDEAALVRALRDRRLASAGLDVFEREPPMDSPLLEMSNVVLSPHIAGISTRSQETTLRMATAAVIDIMRGRCPDGLLNPEVLA